MPGRSSTADPRPAAWLAAGMALALSACAPEPSRARVGEAAGAFDCEIFLPGTSPANVGDGAITVTVDGDARILAQTAAAFAVDGAGHQTLDPASASYFAVQVFQFVSETELEIFEIRVLPDDWQPEAAVPFDGVRAVGFFGRVIFDGNGNAAGATIVARTTGGNVLLEEAGREPRAPVVGTLDDVTLLAE